MPSISHLCPSVRFNLILNMKVRLGHAWVGFSAAVEVIKAQNISIFPPELAYLLPSGFEGNVSQSFLQTIPSNQQLSGLFSSAQNSTFIAYDQEFIDLFGPEPKLDPVTSSSVPFADEMGVWVWDHNQVWMASSAVNGTTYVSVLDLSTGNVSVLNSSIDVLNPNGGGYHNGLVYIAGDGNETVPPSIYQVNPSTGETSVIVNSYFGLRFGGPNDLTWAERGGKSYMFFTDDPLSAIYNGGDLPQVPDAVWRFDPQAKTLLPVIDRTDVLVPNGIRVNANSTLLFVTDTPPLTYGANSTTASSAIYVFDLDEDGFPSNRRLFGIAERGIADGIHLDDAGRVWTGEADGIVIRNSKGKVIGMVNSLTILGADSPGPLENFALAGDKLIILAYDRIYSVQLTFTVVTNMT
jgi:gluconolactonase